MISATKFQPHNISEVQTGLCSPKDLLSQISDQLWLIHPCSCIFTMRAVPSLWNRRRRRDMMMCLAKNQNTQMSPCRTWRILACLVLSLRMENLSMLTVNHLCVLLRKVGARGLMTSEPPFGYLTKFQFRWNKPEQEGVASKVNRKAFWWGSLQQNTIRKIGMTNLRCTGIPVAWWS